MPAVRDQGQRHLHFFANRFTGVRVTVTVTRTNRFLARWAAWRHRSLTVRDVRTAEAKVACLTDAEIYQAAGDCRKRAQSQRYSFRLAKEFCGLICESVFRAHGFRLHNCQIQALLIADRNVILEMQTGEGKTVVTGAIAALQSMIHPTVHVSTTNAYLAARDHEKMRGVFDRLQITSSILPEQKNTNASRRAYRASVVYGAGYQFGFDYLRDQLRLRNEKLNVLGKGIVHRMRGYDPYRVLVQPAEFHVVIVDEADSVMIDEALTPLIISRPEEHTYEDPRPYKLAMKVVSRLKEGEDFEIDHRTSGVVIFESAIQTAHDFIAGERSISLERPWRTYIHNALSAERLFSRDAQYVVANDEVQLVDQNTGRIQPDRRWQNGLHQAIECKENVTIRASQDSSAQISRQRFLGRYQKLIGLTGTAMAAADEFREVYGCEIRPIPVNRPCLRKQLPTRFFATQNAKLNAICKDVVIRHGVGQPVLIGTRTIRQSREVESALAVHKLKSVVLNGVQDQDEASIVAAAGRSGAITIATNMAGRGTDIQPDKNALASGGLHVIGACVNDSRRIDRQLAGRAARQGQPGSCQFFVSADDTVLVENASSLPTAIRSTANSDGESRKYPSALEKLQRQIENRRHQDRRALMKRERWMDSVRSAMHW